MALPVQALQELTHTPTALQKSVNVGCENRRGTPCEWKARYRGTSPIRNCSPLGPYSRPMPRALRWS